MRPMFLLPLIAMASDLDALGCVFPHPDFPR